MLAHVEEEQQHVMAPSQDLVWPDRSDRKVYHQQVEEARDEEEMWLAAVEEGNLARLESVDSELRYLSRSK
jgi:hypothetical protein